MPHYEFLPDPHNPPKENSPWQQEIGQATGEKSAEKEPQKEREESEMPQNLKEEAESSVQNDEPEETADTSEQKNPNPTCRKRQYKEKSIGKWPRREHQKKANENLTGRNKM